MCCWNWNWSWSWRWIEPTWMAPIGLARMRRSGLGQALCPTLVPPLRRSDHSHGWGAGSARDSLFPAAHEMDSIQRRIWCRRTGSFAPSASRTMTLLARQAARAAGFTVVRACADLGAAQQRRKGCSVWPCLASQAWGRDCGHGRRPRRCAVQSHDVADSVNHRFGPKAHISQIPGCGSWCGGDKAHGARLAR